MFTNYTFLYFLSVLSGHILLVSLIVTAGENKPGVQ